MSSVNPDSVTGQGEFHPSRPRDEPLTTKGHAIGKLVGNDAAPEFHAETHPPGTAPKDRSFKPNPTSETPGQANNEDTLGSEDKESTYTSAESTLGGATSKDVHTGYGHPGSGQVASDNTHKKRTGLVGRSGASGIPASLGQVDESQDPRQRGLDRESAGIAGKKDTERPGAEERVPESADTVAAERD